MVTTAVLVFSFLIALSVFLPRLEPFMAILIAGIVFTGIPHGALDIFLLQKISAKPKDLFGHLGLYLLGILIMAVAWWLVPEGAFLFFILFSCYHFAQSDLSVASTGFLRFSRENLEFYARFFIPFFIPFGLQSERSIELARLIFNGAIFEQLTPVFTAAAILAIILSLCFALTEIWAWLKNGQEWRSVSLEPLVLCILFLKLDPLYAFGIYFCFVHSIKHLVHFFSSNVSFSTRQLLPFWLIPVTGVIALAAYTSSVTQPLESNLFKWAIILISSMALPHTLIIYYTKKRKILAPL